MKAHLRGGLERGTGGLGSIMGAVECEETASRERCSSHSWRGSRLPGGLLRGLEEAGPPER